MTTPAIETTHLRKEYSATIAVQDLSLRVPAGEVFGFLGPNGAGKSTTVKMLLGLVSPTGGEARLFGEPPHRPSSRARVGFLPEHFRFHEWLKADEFLILHGKLFGMSSADLKSRIPELLALVELPDAAHRKLSHFSKGMLQRIGLAQAMLHRPKLIFLDEPTSGLDPLGRRLVRDIIAHLKIEGTTVFLNSHFLSEIEVTCDRVAFINRGRVVHTDTMAHLLRRTTEVTVRAEPLSPELLASLAQVGHHMQQNGNSVSLWVENPQSVPEIAHIVAKHGAALYELHPRQTSLEDIFVSIIGQAEEKERA